jgi:uncharacterized protein with PQ loop repeat
MQPWWPTALGMVAGLCTSFSFVPQVIKAWRQGDTRRSRSACTLQRLRPTVSGSCMAS